MKKTKYQKPITTADIIVEKEDNILLIKRKHEPYKHTWALPGGHTEYGKETVQETAIRELEEETGIIVPKEDMLFFKEYSEPNRDPRGHYITHVYIAQHNNKHKGILQADDDAEDTQYFHKEKLPTLAFDHKKIINDYFKNKESISINLNTTRTRKRI